MQKDHLEVILEDINSKFDLVLEGHESLRESFHKEIHELAQKTDERFDLVDVKIEALNHKIDAVAADLKEHRADTEAHHGVWRVKEGD
ncbi:MAG: hypothetical protein C0622_08925 [Desulfuromonas sp.]|nr:MAG: hypothetical protein C0622_08925 [Desulfuromonas sp.]